MRWVEDIFAAACWLAAFAGVAVVMVGVSA